MLTGPDAVEAIKAYTRLGETRFDAAKVARAVRTAPGRLRLNGSLTLRGRFSGLLSLRAARTTRRASRALRGAQRPARAAVAVPARPALSGRGA